MISEPCIKLWGPKKESALPATSTFVPSRAITRYDATVDPEDIHVLQFAYTSDRKTRFGSGPPIYGLFRNIAFVYGSSIEHVALRHAIVAFVNRQTGAGGQTLYLKKVISAFSALREKLNDPASLNEGDLFVACLLGAFSAVDRDLRSLHANMTGYALIMKHLADRVGGNIKTYPLSVFWPIARNEFHFGEVLGCEPSDSQSNPFWEMTRQVLGMETVSQLRRYCNAFLGGYHAVSYTEILLILIRQRHLLQKYINWSRRE